MNRRNALYVALAFALGGWFNLNGDRARAEELFGMALGKNPDEVWHFTLAAGSYLGVQPF